MKVCKARTFLTTFHGKQTSISLRLFSSNEVRRTKGLRIDVALVKVRGQHKHAQMWNENLADDFHVRINDVLRIHAVV